MPPGKSSAWLLDSKFLEGSLRTASSHLLQRSALALCGRNQENWRRKRMIFRRQLAKCQRGVRAWGTKDGQSPRAVTPLWRWLPRGGPTSQSRQLPSPCQRQAGLHCPAELQRHPAYCQLTPASFRCIHGCQAIRNISWEGPRLSMGASPVLSCFPLCSETSSQTVHFVPYSQKSRGTGCPVTACPQQVLLSPNGNFIVGSVHLELDGFSHFLLPSGFLL